MNTKTEVAYVVVLSKVEADALLASLDKLVSLVRDEAYDLKSVQQRLSDSVWLAGWKREDVSLELRPVEIIGLSEAVVTTLDEHAWGDDDCKTLEAIVHRLSLATPTPVLAVAGIEQPNIAPVHSCTG